MVGEFDRQAQAIRAAIGIPVSITWAGTDAALEPI
jgi:hypothetical protein